MEGQIAGSIMGIQDSLQNTYRDDSLSIVLWIGMPTFGRIGIQVSLGDQEMGDELGNNRNKKKNSAGRVRRMAGEGVSKLEDLQGEDKKMA